MTIEILYPDIANLYGDRMNARYLALALPDAEIVETALRAVPAFASRAVDLVLIGAMTESAQELAITALSPYRDALAERMDNGGVTLATGNALEIFGQRIENEDGTVIHALGILDIFARRIRPRRRNSLYIGKFGDTDIVGFNSRFSDVFGDETPLFQTVRGVGRNTETTDEGVRRRNFMGTYVQGPLLPLNPPFTRELLNLIGAENAAIPFETAARAAYDARVREFADEKTNMVYS
ncbi:MAG: hypothetical protein LBN02_10425 [Oscillospiraceae bacterium]|jgi:CobQ-like glutamine amidotransferase family enzyme|nr:hypothetical protein [Oscillospiraceae bacterium]